MRRREGRVPQRGWLRFLEKEGIVGNLDGLPRRPRVEARPYLSTESRLAERRYFAVRGDTVLSRPGNDANIGLDIQAPITNTKTADITINPDFAQAEVDLALLESLARREVVLDRVALSVVALSVRRTAGSGRYSWISRPSASSVSRWLR